MSRAEPVPTPITHTYADPGTHLALYVSVRDDGYDVITTWGIVYFLPKKWL